jgi:uncharacterized protein YjbI with pentapeptide repeats
MKTPSFLKLLKVFSAATAMGLSTFVPASAFNQDHVDKVLAGSQCMDCDLSGADLRNVPWNLGGSFDGSDFTGANLSGVSMKNVSMSHANLSNANLSNITGYNWGLFGAELSGANLSGTSFRESNLWNATNVDLSGVTICASDLPDGSRAADCP